jgi:hypothetical protein
MSDPAFREALLEAARRIAASAPEHVRLAHNEADDSDAPEMEAAHFLKIDGRRIGRDVEVYGLMARMLDAPHALVQFAEEIVLPLKAAAPETYPTAAEAMKRLGREVFPDRADAWDALFDDHPAGPTP